jgi:hypothetical protein
LKDEKKRRRINTAISYLLGERNLNLSLNKRVVWKGEKSKEEEKESMSSNEINSASALYLIKMEETH